MAREAKGDREGALADYTKVIELDPRNVGAYNNRGNRKRDKGDLDGAIADYTRALEVNPRYALAYNNRGLVRKQKGDFDGAITDYTKAVEIDPTYARAFDNRGDARLAKDDPAGAAADYGRAIAIDSSFAVAWTDRGFARATLGDQRSAIADYTKAISLDSTWAYRYEGRAWVQLGARNGQAAYADAVKFLDLVGPRDGHSIYAVLVATWGLRMQRKDSAATAFLRAWVPRVDSTAWPYPALRYLSRDLPAAEFIALATNDDKMTEARTYIGFDLALSGRSATALPHFQWVRAHGTRSYYEYPLALAELRRAQGPAATESATRRPAASKKAP